MDINFIDVAAIGGTAEVAQLLQCPKQQIHALRRRRDFPKPVTRLAATPIWNLSEIDQFRQAWVRRKDYT